MSMIEKMKENWKGLGGLDAEERKCLEEHWEHVQFINVLEHWKPCAVEEQQTMELPYA